MKKLYTLLFACLSTVCATAQTLNITTSDGINYQFPAASAGDMTFTDGTTLTILNKAFTISGISSMSVSESSSSDVDVNAVNVVYSSSGATVTIGANAAQYVTATVSSGYVKIVQSDALTNDLIEAGTASEINYVLSGSSSNGGFYMSGSSKATVTLSSLTLTNAAGTNSGAAIHIEDGKRIDVKVSGTNTLTDYASGSQKGCLYVKGHAEFENSGTLNVVGNKKHGIKTGDYCEVNGPTINVTSAASDGINCTEFFWMRSGTVTISGTSDDGIQCDIDDSDGNTTAATDTSHSDEDTGSVYIDGGSITISVTATAAKGIKGEGSMVITTGTVNVTTSGSGEWDSDDSETKAASGISMDGDITISGGDIDLTSSGSGGKGMKCDGSLTISGSPTIDVVTTGGLYYNNGSTENTNYSGDTDNVSSNYYSSPKGIKAGTKTTSGNTTTYSGDVQISGGTININTSGHNAEGLESKNTMTISGGTIDIDAYDDAINAAQELYLTGGTITAVATENDAIDSNANLYIQGGTIIACGADGAECGLDAAEGYKLYITGGTVLSIAANNNDVTSTTGSQCVLDTSLSSSVTGGTAVTVTSGSTTLASFTVPGSYNSGSSSAPRRAGPGGGGGGDNPGGGTPGGGGSFGGGSANVLISCSGLTSGSSYTITVGSTSATATASTSYTSSSSGGGGR